MDPAYGLELRRASAAGVLLLAWPAEVRRTGVRLVRSLPVVLPALDGSPERLHSRTP